MEIETTIEIIKNLKFDCVTAINRGQLKFEKPIKRKETKMLSEKYYSCILYEQLTKDFPAPWRLEYWEMEAHYDRPQVQRIAAADNSSPLTLETHSGDGDMFYLRNEGAEALVVFVNGIHKILEAKREVLMAKTK